MAAITKNVFSLPTPTCTCMILVIVFLPNTVQAQAALSDLLSLSL